MKRLGVGCVVALVVAACGWAWAAEGADEAVALTVYNDGNAIVKETRTIDVPQGTGEVRYTGVAKTIDPTSVTFRSKSDPEGTTILEQNYEYDLVSASKLLEKYVGKAVTVVGADGTETNGTLMSFSNTELVIKTDGGVDILKRDETLKRVSVGELPEGLITEPTLMWMLKSDKGGSQKVEVAYSASNISWKADYITILNADDTAMDLDGWVTITNNSGKTYTEAALKLIAGEVHRVEQPRPARAMMMERVGAAPQAPQFEEKAFSEYHLYALGRPATVKDNQIKQIQLLNAAAVPVTKKYLYDPLRGFQPWWNQPMMDDFNVAEKGKIQTYILFQNDKKSNLGMPLPAGRVRVFKYDNKDLEFIGEDSIDHTPVDEKVELLIGTAFDITAERTRTNFVKGRGANWMEESFQIVLRNHKDAPVTVYDREHLYRWTNWKITASSTDFNKLDAQTMEFPVTVKPAGEETVTYTVRYEW